MITLPLCWILAVSSFGTGSSSAPPAAPLQGPPAPSQSVRPTSPTSSTRPIKPLSTPQPLNRGVTADHPKGVDGPANGPLYIYPGVVRAKDGRWEGYDYLYNVGYTIPIEVTVVKPTDASVPISEENIKQNIISEFSKAGIDTSINVTAGRPPAAIFNMLILVYPINDGFIALCDGRLLEAVHVQRVTPASSEGVFQAITWEHKNLIVSPADGFNDLLSKTVDNIVRVFLERHTFFESIRKKREGGLLPE